LDLLFAIALFVFGLAFGSFLNVCISRLPADESIVRPGSHCLSCGRPIRWYDNLPVLSWLILRGHCRDCGARIPLRYPLVELLAGILFVATYVHFGASWFTLKYCVFCFLVVGLIFMDAETGLLPREFTYTGIVLGLGFSWIAPPDTAATDFLLQLYGVHALSAGRLALLDSLLGAAVGAAFFYLAWALYYLLRKRHGLGFGDVALTAMAGAFLGLKLVIFVIFSSTLLAALAALVMLAFSVLPSSHHDRGEIGRDATDRGAFLHRELPFGVFLGIGSVAAIFIGQRAWQWYLNLFW
jgi:leader peptidase (prepilin peptidase)/N-methyltransferase